MDDVLEKSKQKERVRVFFSSDSAHEARHVEMWPMKLLGT